LDMFVAILALNLVLSVFEAGVEAIEGIGVGFLAVFASRADARDERVIVEAFKSAVDVGEFVVDDGHEVAGTVAADADADFPVGLVFEDFGAGVVFG
jgi:hypothetical protein